MRISDEELEQLITELESDRVERKQSFKGDTPKRARQAVCGFANDLPNHQRAGLLIIGVTDGGDTSNIRGTAYRNPNLGDALRVFGYVQRFGVGLHIARKALLQNGNPDLEFNYNTNFVLCTIRKKT